MDPDMLSVGFYDPFSVYPRKDFESKFPLTSLHWKYDAARPVQSIPLLPVKMVEEVPKANAKSIASVYARIMFVKFDNLDEYRSQVRPLIKEWLKQLVTPAGDWMIVYVAPANSKEKQSTIIKVSNFGKLLRDFGPEGKELTGLGFTPTFDRTRICKYRQGNSELLTDVIVNLKGLLVDSFSQKYAYFSRELAPPQAEKGRVQKPIERIRLKFGLAGLLNDMHLFQDALEVFNDMSSNDVVALLQEFPPQSTVSISPVLKQRFFAQYKYLPEKDPQLFDILCTIFANQSALLQSLATHATTISISAIYVSQLFQKSIDFLSELLVNYRQSLLLAEFAIRMIDEYISLPLVAKLIGENSKQGNEYDLHEILEFRGELLLFQRSRYKDIAINYYGYTVIGVSDVSIEERSNHSSGNPVKEKPMITYQPIIDAMSTPETFYAFYENLTESIIKDFVKSGREKTIDIMSIDLALMAYQQGHYKQALSIIQDSYDYFISKGWNFMGGFLLEIYLDCLHHDTDENYEKLTLGTLKLFFSIFHHGRVVNSIGVNNYGAIKHHEYFESLVNRIRAYSSKIDRVLTFPLEFAYEIKPFIGSEKNRYFIKMSIPNRSPLNLEFKAIELVLEDSDGMELEFTTEGIEIHSESTETVKLWSKDFKEGQFQPKRLTIQVYENLVYTKEFPMPKNTTSDLTIQHSEPGSSTLSVNDIPATNDTVGGLMEKRENESKVILRMFQHSSSVWCEFTNTEEIELGITEVNFCIHSSDEQLEDVEVTVVPATPGVTLSIQSRILLDNPIPPHSTHTIRIPFTYYSDNKLVNLGAMLRYRSGDKWHSHTMSSTVDITLEVSVTVQDSFRAQFLYSKFTIGSSQAMSPLRLLSSELVSSDNDKSFEIVSPVYPKLNQLVVFSDQPASLFYKIIPRVSELSPSRCFDLYVSYMSLKKECQQVTLEALESALETIDASSLMYLCRTKILSKAQFDINHYALYGSVKVVNAQELLDWSEEQLKNFIPDTSKIMPVLSSVLSTIQSSATCVSDFYKLHISVPMPILNFLQIVSYNFDRKSQFSVGEPIKMTLAVKTIDKWTGPGDEWKDCKFELTIPSDDNWSVTGLLKTTFIPKEAPFMVELVLVPLVVGKLPLPKVLIKHSPEKPHLLVDFAYANGSETLLIVPESESITFTF
ncbi:hypothetical protein DIURU_003406 [Diutina rugosa]|uniref:Trafficking protein particle complex subunit 11 domain-containing protein n=1 Tax=Diutina rugosa TaxID=5481 RepID=A0A642UMW3_DIURU|nr:uncharacterized protein DIURU_003406 [Diutina rugosa]KAA8901036.1 hypothetical protein DIURU_003406 [Diutina rugosa]